MRVTGQAAIWIALLMSTWAFVVYVVGGQRARADLIAAGDRAIHVVTATTFVATAILLRGLIGHDFGMRYVATYSSINLPQPYLVSALWSGQRGSLLLGTFLLSVMTLVTIVPLRRMNDRRHTVFLAVVLVVSLAILCIAQDPLGALDWAPVDGIGMHPMLQSPFAVVYPPLLFAAYAAVAVAGTRSVAPIVARSIDEDGIHAVTRWTVTAWLLNTLGILASVWWAYREPSRSSGWISFPLETGAMLPWLAMTAYLLLLKTRRADHAVSGWIFSLPVAAMLAAVPAAALTTAAIAGQSKEAAESPLFIALAISVAIGIGGSAWFASSRLRETPISRCDRRTYALVVIAFALVMVGASIGGHFFRSQSTLRVSVAAPADVRGATGGLWSFVSQGLSSYNVLNRQVTALALEVKRDGAPAGLLSTEFRQYVDVQGEPVFQASKEAAVRSSLREDVYVVLEDIADDNSATLTVAFNPLMAWLWIGGFLLALGGVLAAWPVAQRDARS